MLAVSLTEVVSIRGCGLSQHGHANEQCQRHKDSWWKDVYSAKISDLLILELKECVGGRRDGGKKVLCVAGLEIWCGSVWIIGISIICNSGAIIHNS